MFFWQFGRSKQMSSFSSYASRPVTLPATEYNRVFLNEETGTFHMWTSYAGWVVQSREYLNVLDYGVKRNDLSSDCSAIINDLVAKILAGQILITKLFFPIGTYFTKKTLNLSGTVRDSYGVSIVGEDQQRTIITGNIDGPLIFNGVRTSQFYVYPGSIENITLINQSAGANASAVDATQTGRFLMRNVNLRVNNFGVTGLEVVSAVFSRVFIMAENSKLNRARAKRGFKLFGRNCAWKNCISFVCDIGFDIDGYNNSFCECDNEYGLVIFRFGYGGTFKIDSCQGETSDVFLTNAINIPFSKADDVPWVDNNDLGAGCEGTVSIVSSFIYFEEQNVTNAIVIKEPSNGKYKLSIRDCQFLPMSGSTFEYKLTSSFKPGEMKPLHSGVEVFSSGNTGLIGD